MKNLLSGFRRFLREEDGMQAAEVAIIVGVAAVIIGIISVFFRGTVIEKVKELVSELFK